MRNSQRIFVDALQNYCARHGIVIDVRSDGWLIAMQRGDRRMFAFGYDVGLNSAVAHRIANDKAATADVLAMAGVPCIPHWLFLSPRMNEYVSRPGAWEEMLAVLARHPQGVVVKPNEGTTGRSVFMASTKPGLELAVDRIFASHFALAVSPRVNIEEEVRVVMIDDAAVAVYGKSRPSVTGDGQRSLLELALAATPAEARSTVLPGMIRDLDKADLDCVPPAGQRRILNWRHNLDSGAQPIVLAHGDTRQACVALAIQAAKAIGIRFASVDVVKVDGVWQVLEINSGVMMEALARHHRDLVEAVYAAALDALFA